MTYMRRFSMHKSHHGTSHDSMEEKLDPIDLFTKRGDPRGCIQLDIDSTSIILARYTLSVISGNEDTQQVVTLPSLATDKSTDSPHNNASDVIYTSGLLFCVHENNVPTMVRPGLLTDVGFCFISQITKWNCSRQCDVNLWG
jgi:hypothetical protein